MNQFVHLDTTRAKFIFILLMIVKSAILWWLFTNLLTAAGLKLIEPHSAILTTKTPRFVANAPELHCIRFGMAVGRALFAHDCGGVAVAVFN